MYPTCFLDINVPENRLTLLSFLGLIASCALASLVLFADDVIQHQQPRPGSVRPRFFVHLSASALCRPSYQCAGCLPRYVGELFSGKPVSALRQHFVGRSDMIGWEHVRPALLLLNSLRAKIQFSLCPLLCFCSYTHLLILQSALADIALPRTPKPVCDTN